MKAWQGLASEFRIKQDEVGVWRCVLALTQGLCIVTFPLHSNYALQFIQHVWDMTVQDLMNFIASNFSF